MKKLFVFLLLTSCYQIPNSENSKISKEIELTCNEQFVTASIDHNSLIYITKKMEQNYVPSKYTLRYLSQIWIIKEEKCKDDE